MRSLQARRAAAVMLLVAVAVAPAARGDVPGEIGAHLDGAADRWSAAARAVYAARGFSPLWVGDRTALVARLDALRGAVAGAEREGLIPARYHPERLVLPPGRSDAELAALDVRMTRTLAAYASDLRAGRVQARLVDPEIFVHAGKLDLEAVLREAAAAGDLDRYLHDLAPANAEYRRLRRARAALAAGRGWTQVPIGPKLELGAQGPRVALLRRRLLEAGDLSVATTEPDRFDATLGAAVRRFQVRHGLAADAVVGPATLAALNVPLAARLAQVDTNMERWRWMPDDLGARHVLVNIAGFELEVVEDGAAVMRMKVVVGQRYRRTPVFTGRMTYLEFNPTWTVPPSIARLDIVPKAKADPGYLRAQGIRVLAGADLAREIAPESVDWAGLEGKPVPFVLRQDPGPRNALGRVKFMFPNEFNVYLHDTPARELFARAVRAFSSGCIRVERPIELAGYLLADQSRWTVPAIDALIAAGKTTQVKLREPVPVHMTYSTAWIGEGGDLHFREDIYGRDALLHDAISRKLGTGL